MKLIKHLLVICMVVLLSYGTVIYSVNAGVEGVYMTTFNQMILQMEKDRVIGSFTYKNGKINGVLQGNTLIGTWIHSHAKGGLEFAFTPDFSSFTGKWGYNDAALTKKWNGEKTRSVIPLKQRIHAISPSAVPPEPAKKSAEPKQTLPKIEPVVTERREDDYLTPGQSVMYGVLEVALLSLKRTDDYINGPDKGHFYAVLRFRVKNTGNEETSARIYSDLQWRNPKNGIREGYRRTTGVKLHSTGKYKLLPGTEGEFEEVYMFPDHTLDIQFHLLKGYNPKEVARWRLPIQ
ncbi:hypothetical protein [Desulfobacter vibrioformis]|uniref:hypothetical protein n=1 Tax=Desulfobacter vibrioformis TaxID=34031 RepID=UPI0005595262|nr:hypothetical protein [Desulfobacter vibrioformis]